MKGNNKLLKLILIIYAVIVLTIVIFNLLEPLLYTEKTVGENTNKEEIYNVAHGILSKKYEILLYEDNNKIYDIFSYNCKSKLVKRINDESLNYIIEDFVSFQITNIEEKNKNKYIIYYNEELSDKQIKNKMIIKYKHNKAIIYYDTILEANYE